MQNCMSQMTLPPGTTLRTFDLSSGESSRLKSVCVYCGASDDVKPLHLHLSENLGQQLAANGLRLVYGGGGVGLMGACARSAHAAGGDVLGIMPRFLLEKEHVYADVHHVIVDDMHARKKMMFEQADGFIVLPGGIGTLEEAVEVLSWSRLDLHAKPMVFLDEDGFWKPFFELMAHIIDGRFIPASFRSAFVHCSSPSEAIKILQERLPSSSADFI